MVLSPLHSSANQNVASISSHTIFKSSNETLAEEGHWFEAIKQKSNCCGRTLPRCSSGLRSSTLDNKSFAKIVGITVRRCAARRSKHQPSCTSISSSSLVCSVSAKTVYPLDATCILHLICSPVPSRSSHLLASPAHLDFSAGSSAESRNFNYIYTFSGLVLTLDIIETLIISSFMPKSSCPLLCSSASMHRHNL